MKKRIPIAHTAGLTLIEMLVVVGIVALVSSVIMFNYSSFSTNISIRSLAQDVALAIRKAQTYATSVQAITGGFTSENHSYGIAFSLAAPTGSATVPSQKRFILFADINDNGTYDDDGSCGSVGSECLESFGITTADSIVELRSNVLSSPYTAGTGGYMTILFHRPSPNASVCMQPSANAGCVGTASNGEVVVQSAKGISQHIRVWNTGQISVQ